LAFETRFSSAKKLADIGERFAGSNGSSGGGSTPRSAAA